MNKKVIFTLTIIFLLIILATAWWLKPNSSRPGSRQQSQPVVVEVTPASQKVVMNTIEAIGTAKAFESVTISANVTEYVRKLHFNDGDNVEEGDLLVEMATQEEKSRLDEAKAKLLQAQQQYDRIKDLLKKSFSAKSEYDSQKAALDSAKAQVAQINSQLADRSIKAPFGGVLGFRQISVGTLLEPGDAVVTLDMIQPLKIDFTIPEKLLAKVKPGQPFKVFSIAYPDEIFKGKIETINPRLDAASRSISIRGIIENKTLKLKPGMLLKVKLPLGKKRYITVPEESLLAQDKQRYIFVVIDGHAKKRDVKVVKRRGDLVDVTGDLTTGEAVVSKGAFKLKDGQEVRINHAHQ